MRVPTRAREISFTFTPRRVYRPLRSELTASTAGRLVVCARVRRLHCAASFARAAVTAWRKRSPLSPNRCLLPLPQITRPRSPPNLLFRSRRPPCRKGDNVEQKLRFCRGTGGGQWGRGAFCAHRDDEGLKWTAVVQVGFH